MEAILSFVLCCALPPAEVPFWRTDYNAAVQECEKSSGRICVFIGAKWCTACPVAKKRCEAFLEQHPEIMPVYVDYDKDLAWCRNQMSATVLPFIVTYDWKRRLRGTLVGTPKPGELEKLLERK